MQIEDLRTNFCDCKGLVFLAKFLAGIFSADREKKPAKFRTHKNLAPHDIPKLAAHDSTCIAACTGPKLAEFPGRGVLNKV